MSPVIVRQSVCKATTPSSRLKDDLAANFAGFECSMRRSGLSERENPARRE
jgi:hypothetical protein